MPDTHTDFSFLLPHFLNMVESAKGYSYPQAEEWKLDGDKLALKYGTNILSIADLLEHTKPAVPGYSGNINFIDYHSIMVIARSALETYLTFYYIFTDSAVPEEEREYRHKLWVLSSLGNRQRYTPHTPAMQAALDENQRQIDTLMPEIIDSPFFDSRSTSGRAMQAVTQGRSRMDWKPDNGWRALAGIAHMSDRFFDDAYNLFSGISHSDQVIANYANNTNMTELQEGLASTALSITNVVTACFIRDYVAVFSATGAGSYIANNPDLQQKVSILEYLCGPQYGQPTTQTP